MVVLSMFLHKSIEKNTPGRKKVLDFFPDLGYTEKVD